MSRTESIDVAEIIGMEAGILPAIVHAKCPYPFDDDRVKGEARVTVASLCLVFAAAVGFARTRRKDIPLDAFAASLLKGMAFSAKISGSRPSSYEALIVADAERRSFRDYVMRAAGTDFDISVFMAEEMAVSELFRGIAYFRESAFRSFHWGEENGFRHRFTLEFVTGARRWLVPPKTPADRGIAFVDVLLEHLISGFLRSMFTKIQEDA